MVTVHCIILQLQLFISSALPYLTSFTALLVVIELVNGTSAPVTASCTVRYTILTEAHHIGVLEKQRKRQDGRIEGFS